ncbi:MAG: DUF2516 family protein [Actinomycetaceae bacterium]|nr:DUF2516 family protein [Actinomycetaceae bacterium]
MTSVATDPHILAFSIYTFVGYVRFVIWVLFVLLLACALLACVLRPDDDFARARLSKRRWLVILGAGLIVMVWNNIVGLWLPFLWLPFETLLRLGAIIAAIYFLGPEMQRMGPRRGGRSGRKTSGQW